MSYLSYFYYARSAAAGCFMANPKPARHDAVEARHPRRSIVAEPFSKPAVRAGEGMASSRVVIARQTYQLNMILQAKAACDI
jgi:hypothetical protein